MEAKESLRTPRTDLENDLADKAYARLYRRACIKSQREIDLCREAHTAGMKKVAEWLNTKKHGHYHGPVT